MRADILLNHIRANPEPTSTSSLISEFGQSWYPYCDRKGRARYIGAMLKRLVASRRIERVGHGLYKMARPSDTHPTLF